MNFKLVCIFSDVNCNTICLYLTKRHNMTKYLCLHFLLMQHNTISTQRRIKHKNTLPSEYYKERWEHRFQEISAEKWTDRKNWPKSFFLGHYVKIKKVAHNFSINSRINGTHFLFFSFAQKITVDLISDPWHSLRSIWILIIFHQCGLTVFSEC